MSTAKERPAHDFDEDELVCRRCGYDAAEWWHYERVKPREDRLPPPPCSDGGEIARKALGI